MEIHTIVLFLALTLICGCVPANGSGCQCSCGCQPEVIIQQGCGQCGGYGGSEDRTEEQGEVVKGSIPTTLTTVTPTAHRTHNDTVHDWLAEYDRVRMVVTYPVYVAAFEFSTNRTLANYEKQNEVSQVELEFLIKKYNEATDLWREDLEESLKRQLNYIFNSLVFLPDGFKSDEYYKALADMSNIYQSFNICREVDNTTECYDNTNYLPTVRTIESSEVLAWFSLARRNAIGVPMKSVYEEYVKWKNMLAQGNGDADYGERLRIQLYDDADIDKEADRVMAEIQPLYTQLHAYYRRQLIAKYGPGATRGPRGPIGFHIFIKISSTDIMTIYPDVATEDLTADMLRQNYTVDRMYKMSEDFFTSMGLFPMTQKFWENSLFVKPEGRSNLMCHGRAWDMKSPEKDDFRISMCTGVNGPDLRTVHHEMGHIEYFMAYAHQPYGFQDAPSTAFHEAIGDVIALSFATSSHLKTVGLMEDDRVSPEDQIKQDMNMLMRKARGTVGILPHTYIVDKWRWDIYAGKTQPHQYNRHWNQLLVKHLGVAPIENRTDDQFDAGELIHVANDVPYIRYFFSIILQFQFYEALCEDHVGPLHTCDFYGDKKAGAKLKRMLSLGRSLPWPDVLEVMTGSREMSAAPLLRYFQPLMDWLQQENSGEYLGWLEPGVTAEEYVDTFFTPS